jgi:hypothetical protein
MKLFIRIAAFALAIAVATSAAAQTTTAQGKEGRFGLGVGLAAGDDPAVENLIFVPLNLAPNIRIEPFLGWSRSDIDAVPAAAGGSPAFDPQEGKGSDFTLGVGAFFVQPIASQIQLYAGGRLGLQWESFKQPSPAVGKAERRNTIVAAALGGEYLPHPRFAIGAEAMIAYLSIGDTEFSGGGASVEGGGGSASSTQGTIFARVYLF